MHRLGVQGHSLRYVFARERVGAYLAATTAVGVHGHATDIVQPIVVVDFLTEDTGRGGQGHAITGVVGQVAAFGPGTRQGGIGQAGQVAMGVVTVGVIQKRGAAIAVTDLIGQATRVQRPVVDQAIAVGEASSTTPAPLAAARLLVCLQGKSRHDDGRLTG